MRNRPSDNLRESYRRSMETTLAEMQSHRMRGCGEAPEGFAEYWDFQLDAIEQHLTRILQTLKED